LALRACRGLALSEKVVILLSALALILSVANVGRAIMAVRYSVRLPDLPTTISLDYLAAMGGFWGVAFLACSVGLSLFREWARRATLAAIALYQLNGWLNRLLFAASDYADQTVPRDIVLTVIFLLLFWIPLNLSPIRQAFKRTGEE